MVSSHSKYRVCSQRVPNVFSKVVFMVSLHSKRAKALTWRSCEQKKLEKKQSARAENSWVRFCLSQVFRGEGGGVAGSEVRGEVRVGR
jgi:hypothetical protein